MKLKEVLQESFIALADIDDVYEFIESIEDFCDEDMMDKIYQYIEANESGQYSFDIHLKHINKNNDQKIFDLT